MTEGLREVQLLSGESKEIEQELVEFYKTVGRMVNQNSKATEVFAYLKVHDTLSQEQLRQLTGFSLSTISSILQLFLQVDIVDRRMIPGTHKNLYRINRERVKFDCNPPALMLEDLETLDAYIEEKQSEHQALRNEFPVEIEFLRRRLNSIRNYIEVQRRQIGGEKKRSFLQEDVSELLPLDQLITYPFDTRELEERITGILSRFKDDPVRGRILSIFFIRRSLTQQALTNLSGFSRSTISRFLRRQVKEGYIRALPKEYQKPGVYYLESVSLSTLSVVLKADDFIFSYVPRLREIISKLQSREKKGSDGNEVDSLTVKAKEMLRQIETFRRDTKPLRDAHRELTEFLNDAS
jgi:DNA-binding transcriptional regulator GbsR (MarR family)